MNRAVRLAAITVAAGLALSFCVPTEAHAKGACVSAGRAPVVAPRAPNAKPSSPGSKPTAAARPSAKAATMNRAGGYAASCSKAAAMPRPAVPASKPTSVCGNYAGMPYPWWLFLPHDDEDEERDAEKLEWQSDNEEWGDV